MELDQALRQVEEEMERDRTEAGNPGVWRATLTRELTKALRDVYGVPSYLATTSVLRELQEADNPVEVLEDLVIRHRLAVLCGDVEYIRAEMAKQGEMEEAGQ